MALVIVNVGPSGEFWNCWIWRLYDWEHWFEW